LHPLAAPADPPAEAQDMKHARQVRAAVAALLLLVPLLTAGCAKTVSGTFDDATITTRVKTLLLNDREVGVLPIEVDTFQGVVTLSGTVHSDAQRDQAIALARKAIGVKDVRSTLTVVPPQP
jgi:hypothetical protein